MFRISKSRPRIGGATPIRRQAIRSFAQVVQTQKHARRATKQEGTVAEFFENLDGESPPFPARFADLKKEMCADRSAVEHAWRGVLKELEDGTEEIAQRGNEVSTRPLRQGSCDVTWAYRGVYLLLLDGHACAVRRPEAWAIGGAAEDVEEDGGYDRHGRGAGAGGVCIVI